LIRPEANVTNITQSRIQETGTERGFAGGAVVKPKFTTGTGLNRAFQGPAR
jgi:hypothetical protein